MRSANQLNSAIHNCFIHFFFLFLSFHPQSQERGGRGRHGGPSALGNGSHVNTASSASYLHHRGKRKEQWENEWTEDVVYECFCVSEESWPSILCNTTKKQKCCSLSFPEPFKNIETPGYSANEPRRGFYIQAITVLWQSYLIHLPSTLIQY